MTHYNANGQAHLQNQGQSWGKKNRKTKSSSFSQPTFRIDVPGFPEVEVGVFVADENSKNAGEHYYDVRRLGEDGKRFKLLRLEEDYYGSLLAHAVIAEKRSADPTLSAAERERFGELADVIYSKVWEQLSPTSSGSQTVSQEAASPFSRVA